MKIRELTNVYSEEIYAIELISNIDLKTLDPFKWSEDTNKLEVIGFKVVFNEEEKINIIEIMVDLKEYEELKNWIKKENYSVKMNL